MNYFIKDTVSNRKGNEIEIPYDSLNELTNAENLYCGDILLKCKDLEETLKNIFRFINNETICHMSFYDIYSFSNSILEGEYSLEEINSCLYGQNYVRILNLEILESLLLSMGFEILEETVNEDITISFKRKEG